MDVGVAVVDMELVVEVELVVDVNRVVEDMVPGGGTAPHFRGELAMVHSTATIESSLILITALLGSFRQVKVRSKSADDVATKSVAAHVAQSTPVFPEYLYSPTSLCLAGIVSM